MLSVSASPTNDECTDVADAHCALYDDAKYDAGINWCYFYIRVGATLAAFRLHMYGKHYAKLFEVIAGTNLYSVNGSTSKVIYGSDTSTSKYVYDKRAWSGDAPIPVEFRWLGGSFPNTARTRKTPPAKAPCNGTVCTFTAFAPTQPTEQELELAKPRK